MFIVIIVGMVKFIYFLLNYFSTDCIFGTFSEVINSYLGTFVELINCGYLVHLIEPINSPERA